MFDRQKLAAAIRDMEEARLSHVLWAEHLEAHGASGEPCGKCSAIGDVDGTVGSAAENRDWAARYEGVLELLRFMESLYPPAPASSHIHVPSLSGEVSFTQPVQPHVPHRTVKLPNGQTGLRRLFPGRRGVALRAGERQHGAGDVRGRARRATEAETLTRGRRRGRRGAFARQSASVLLKPGGPVASGAARPPKTL